VADPAAHVGDDDPDDPDDPAGPGDPADPGDLHDLGDLDDPGDPGDPGDLGVRGDRGDPFLDSDACCHHPRHSMSGDATTFDCCPSFPQDSPMT